LIWGYLRDWAFFLDLLTWFVEDSADAVALTRRDLNQGGRETAARRLHRLPGIAGNLGAIDLMGSARRLEEALTQGAHHLDLEDGLADLDRRVATLLDASAP
jgi:HPt (histidine-containing phosphotransfer) domain-containing protein